jgi:hypothetical protein
MSTWSLSPQDVIKGERDAKRRSREIKEARRRKYEQISSDLRHIKTQRLANGDLILGIPSGKRVKILREQAIKFAHWILQDEADGK